MRRDVFVDLGAPLEWEKWKAFFVFCCPPGTFRERVRDELEVPKGGMQKGRSEELAAIFEDFGLGDDEAIVDDFEKLGLHSENVVVIEYIGNLGPMLVRHG